MADALGLDSSATRLLYVYYFATQGGYTPGSMTISEFVRFVREDVLTDSAFSSYFDSDTAAQLETLALYTDEDEITRQYTATELASILGMEESLVQTVYALYTAGDVSDKTMTLGDFTGYLTSGVLESSLLSGSVDETTAAQLSSLSALIQAAADGQALTASDLAALLGLDATTAAQLLSLYAMEQVSDEDIANTALTVTEFAAFLTESVLTNESYASQFSAEEAAQIQSLYALLQAGTSGQAYTAAELAALTGMEETVVSQLLYASASGETQDTETATDVETETTDTATDTESETTEASADTENETTETATDTESETEEAAANEEAETEATETSTDENTETTDTATDEETETTEPAMTLPDFLALVVESFSDMLDEETLTQLTQIQTLIGLAQSGQALNGEALAQTFSMESAQVDQLLRLYLTQGEQTAALADFTAWLTDDLLQDESYAALFDESAAAQLTQMNQLVQLAASGAALTPASMAQALGLEEETAALVFQLYYGQSDSTMSLSEFVDYLLNDLAQNPLTATYFDSDTLAQLAQVSGLMQSALDGTAYTYSEMANLLGMDSDTVKLLYTLYDGNNGQLASWRMSMVTMVDYLLSNSGTFSSMMSGSALSQLQTASAIMHGAINGTHYTAAEMASLLGMETEQAEQLYLLYISEYGDTSTWQLSIHELLDFLAEEVLADEDYADLLTDEEQEQLTGAKALADAVLSGETYTPAACAELLTALTDQMDETTVELLYLYYQSVNNSDETWTLSIMELFDYLSGDILDDERFAQWIDEDMRAEIQDMGDSLAEGVDMLKSDGWSRLIVYSTMSDESEETTAFFDSLTAWLDENLQGAYHLIGNSAMVYEMQDSFGGEMTFITLLTAAAIFLVVALTFRSLAVPAILVLLVQCGVYITVTALGLGGGGVYYLALLIVECILMGATIDYAILLTNYYREYRANMPVQPALEGAYNGSIHTILTSGLILILVPGIVSFCFEEMTIRQICRAISIGAFCASLLILFVLPGLLAAFDKLVTRKKERYSGKESSD
ncbi:MAG: MMPL family transporter [Oscillospiraceae bacterium]|nr:MMPL family transporter [Oscillospiraceae bacterium]